MSDRPHLDARAAELKQKLLLSRQRRAAASLTDLSSSLRKTLSSSVEVSPAVKNALQIPHKASPSSVEAFPVLKQPLQNGKEAFPSFLKAEQNSVEADDGGIAALIRSISSGRDHAINAPAHHTASPPPALLPSVTTGLNIHSKPPAEPGHQLDIIPPPEEGLMFERLAHKEAPVQAHKEAPVQTPTNPSSVPTTYRPQKQTGQQNNGKAMKTTDGTISKDSAERWNESLEDKLARLLEEHVELRDWLTMTNFHDIDLRKRKLDRYRKVRALEAEKERIEAEQRKLMEEDEIEMGFRTAAVKPSATPTQTSAPPPKMTPEHADKQDRNTVPVKREYLPDDTFEQRGRPEKYQRFESRRSRQDSRPGHPGDFSRESSPGRRNTREYHQPRRPGSPPRNFRRRPSDFENNRDHGYHHTRYDNGRRWEEPIEIDLGQNRDSRFFIVKSFNEQFVARSKEEGVWVTQRHNVPILSQAFAECKNVILFFSVNGSKAFQGYARMVGMPSANIPRPIWLNRINWPTSDPFRVEWLSKVEVEFYRIGHIKNPYNEGRAVLVGKDGQEVEENCGRELLREMLTIAKRFARRLPAFA